MICRIEALNFRCLRYINQRLNNFEVLVGPNASGKTTFLDVVAFLKDLVTGGLDVAIRNRTQNFEDLVWNHSSDKFELAIELAIPENLRKQIARPSPSFSILRYEVAIGLESKDKVQSILAERALFKKDEIPKKGEIPKHVEQQTLFPVEHVPPPTLISSIRAKNIRTVVNKVPGGNDNFYSEVYHQGGKGWAPAFKLGPRKSALGNLPADGSKFPVTSWLKDLLTDGVQQLMLNSLLIRQASPPGQPRGFKPDGSNLPWVIENLKSTSDERFRDWINHVRTALPDIEDILTVERPDDKHRYLKIRYSGNLEVPSWMVSDGTLRLLALTLPAYLPDFSGIYLIEEPENGIHPRAVETMFQSLSSVYGAQILLATHSPVILSMAGPEQILCFSKTESGVVDIIRGEEHPILRNWKGEPNLSVLFAGGVLG
ncbi:MAG: AAA family ATPase [bacterium]